MPQNGFRASARQKNEGIHKVPKYKVTQTATAEVWGKSEDEVIELVSGEFFAFPEYTHEVEVITPAHKLHEIKDALLEMGVSVYYDDYRNNLHDFLRVSPNESHPDDDEYPFFIQVFLNDEEEFDGRGYALVDSDYNTLLTLPAHYSPKVLANLFVKELRKQDKKEIVSLVATLEEIVKCLTDSGVTATVVDFGRYEGQPKVIEIGNSLPVALNGDRIMTPEWTLFQNLSDDETISGTGYHLTHEDDESQIIAEIGNETAPRIVYAIATAIATTKERVNLR
jgi:hypothetical protein